MTAYEFDNLPDEGVGNPIPAEFTDQAEALFQKILSGELTVAKEVRIAHLYSRKGFIATDSFAREHARSTYGASDDDLVLQLTVRLPGWNLDKVETDLADLELAIINQREEAALASLNEQIERTSQIAADAKAQREKILKDRSDREKK